MAPIKSNKYDSPNKVKVRQELFEEALKRLQFNNITPQNARVLILVDGTLPQNYDITELVKNKVSTNNIFAISKSWDNNVKNKYYQGVNVIDNTLHEFLADKSQSDKFDMVYLDFCKPLCNELNPGNPESEFHFRSLFNLCYHDKLSPFAVLITNFNVTAYFNNELYRKFMLAYVWPDFHVERRNGKLFSQMSYRTFRMNQTILVSDKVFSDENDPCKNPRYAEQQISILIAFMQSFLSDMGEVYIPAYRFRSQINLSLLKELDKPFLQDGKPITLGKEVITNYMTCQGRLKEVAGLLGNTPSEIRNNIINVIDNIDYLKVLSFMITINRSFYESFSVHSFPEKYVAGFPYIGKNTLMLPIIYNVIKNQVDSEDIWGFGSESEIRNNRVSDKMKTNEEI